jgi:2-polyprenyl-6-methoxyphenol hydroxylase-like FAD-dependent oxidoreductase
MEIDTDVIIVGSGPTGLMMAIQLARFGVSFRIFDKQEDRAQESRAFGIQAKTMEIFQNLGISAEFLKQAIVGTEASFYVSGKQRFKIDFTKIDAGDTPFPTIFFLPQADTEKILLNHLANLPNAVSVERQTELLSFQQQQDGIEAEIKNNLRGEREKIRCRYIIGCDGAHSRVRQELDIPFEGAAYNQEFILADVSVTWPSPKNNITAFLGKEGVFLYIPLQKNYSRLIIIGMNSLEQSGSHPPTLEAIESFGRHITRTNIQLSNPQWISRFHLHHRAVKHYIKGRAFLAGDAAHIHSPVGAQGMNTGLQDATNLAWKLAFVLKYGAPKTLLETYQTERQRIGEVLLKTTDKIFGIMTKRNVIFSKLRLYLFPIVMSLLTRSTKFNNLFFRFMSELGVRYHENPFVLENTQSADAKFLSAPQAGCRAPDAPYGISTLFELFREKPCNILLFQAQAEQTPEQEKQILALEKLHPEMIALHKLVKSPTVKVIFDRYGITSSGVYFIRPDGYIGFRAFGTELESLLQYLHKLFGSIKN